jgi:hypothetical protein
MSYAPVKARHLLIDDATIALVIGKMLSVFLQCKMSMMAHSGQTEFQCPLLGVKADISRTFPNVCF